MKILLCALLALAAYVAADNKVVCYYNSKSHFREGQGKFDVNFIDPALQFCTHLIYGYAGVNADSYKAEPLNEVFDVTRDNYRHITALKRKYPGLRVLLSVGGGEDIGDDHNIKYRTILESVEHRLAFVNSAQALVKNFGFDGLDLAWEFPETKPKKIRGSVRNFFHKLKTSVVGESEVDDKPEEHKEQFTAFVREIRNAFRHDGLLLSLSVLPNVNSSVYYDPRALAPNLDFITLQAFDFYTPKRNPKEADYPAPLYELIDRKYDENVDYQVRHWLQKGAPNNKILIGIPAFGRAWKMDDESSISGVPPLHIDGSAEAGPYSKEEGLLSYPEICVKLANPQKLTTAAGKHLRKMGDPSKRKEEWQVNDATNRYGTFAFRTPDDSGEGGIWVGYEDADTSGNKAGYAKAKGLGGVAVVDITLDDFRGLCTGDKFPVLRAAKFRL